MSLQIFLERSCVALITTGKHNGNSNIACLMSKLFWCSYKSYTCCPSYENTFSSKNSFLAGVPWGNQILILLITNKKFYMELGSSPCTSMNDVLCWYILYKREYADIVIYFIYMNNILQWILPISSVKVLVFR